MATRRLDSLFDENSEEVGAEIEAYCPAARCKADTTHTIVTMYEDEIRRVQCSVCADIHAFRKPRGDSAETTALEPVKRRKLDKKPSWQEAMAMVTETEIANCRPYSIRDSFEELEVVRHTKFGIGFVTQLLPDNKLEITFRDDRKVLIHKRTDVEAKISSEIADLPAPRETKKRRRRKVAPASELASRLSAERRRALAKKDDFDETVEAKLAAAERAADTRHQISELAKEEGITTDAAARKLLAEKEKERKRLEKEKEKERKRLEKEKDKEKKRIEREKLKAKKEKEREKLKAKKVKERERAAKARERERQKKLKEKERFKKAKDREKLKKAKEREKLKAAQERDRARKQAERERAAAKKAAAAAKKKKAAALAKKKAAALKKKKLAALKKKQKLKVLKKKKAAALAKKKAAALKKKKAAAVAKKRKAAARRSPPPSRRAGGKKSVPIRSIGGGKKTVRSRAGSKPKTRGGRKRR